MSHNLCSVSPRERALYLKTLPFAQNLETETIMMAALQMQERRFEAGEHLLREGQPIEGFYILTSGRVRLRQDDQEVARLEAPARVGLIGLLAGDRADTSRGAPGDIVADGRVEALELPADLVEHLLEASSDFQFSLIRWIAVQLLEDRPRDLLMTTCGPPEADTETAGQGVGLYDRLRWLQSSSLLGRANLEAVLELARHQKILRAEPGDRLWEADDPADTILSIVEGCVAVAAPEAFSAPTDGFRVEQREFLGLLEALAGRPHSHAARVERPLVALLLEIDLLLEVLEAQVEMAIEMLRTLAAAAVQRRWSRADTDQPGTVSLPSPERPSALLDFGRLDAID